MMIFEVYLDGGLSLYDLRNETFFSLFKHRIRGCEEVFVGGHFTIFSQFHIFSRFWAGLCFLKGEIPRRRMKVW